MSHDVKVLVVGQTPPPYHGQALMIERLLERQFAHVRIFHVRMAFSGSIDEVGKFRIGKVLHLFSVVARIVYHRVIHGVKVLYYPPAGPNRVPLYRDLVILICVRWMFQRTILHFHAGGAADVYPTLSQPMKWLYRRALFNADAAIRLSHSSPDDGRTLQAKRLYIVPNGIADEYPRFAAKKADSPSLRILFMGILCESKGLLVLIDACRRMKCRGVPFELYAIGQFQSTDFESTVRGRLREYDLEHVAHFPGELRGNAKWEALSRADVFCLPSFYELESFPIVLLEAMSFELPVVSTRWRGIVEMVDDGITGYLVAPHDIEAIADSLEQLQTSAELRRRLGNVGRSKFLRDFTLEKHLERMERVFLEAANGRSVQAADNCRWRDVESPDPLLSAPECEPICGSEALT
ncbi:MAG: glycosyltransferase [Pirellulales bacterium]|nr:glycosyltransferase [Pirellulales bacterium]